MTTTNLTAHHDPENGQWLILDMRQNVRDDLRIVATLPDRGPESAHYAYAMAGAIGLLEAAEESLPLLNEFGGPVYGVFMGEDPRQFHPDEEDCTPAEIAAWKQACDEWNWGEGVDRGPGCATFGDGSVYTGAGFGIGTTDIPSPEADNLRAAILAATPLNDPED